ncbi:MAG: hypothetical protein ABI639_05585 [Thermoanaerobaculia bacterium]
MSVAAALAGESWSASVPLTLGANMLHISACQNAIAKDVFVTRAEQVVAGSPQKLFLLWTPEANQAVKQIARETLTIKLSKKELETFAERVRDGVLAILAGRFPIGTIELVDSSGPDVHTVRMIGAKGGGVFGQTPVYDCGNLSHEGLSEVWVGSYEESMRNLPLWTPMLMSDSVGDRTEDISQALARGAAHEIGHGLGMVGGAPSATCGWMNGCDDLHDCESFQATYGSLVNRFEKGGYIMDPGDTTLRPWRIALPLGRAHSRRPSAFSPFDQAYLALLAGGAVP